MDFMLTAIVTFGVLKLWDISSDLIGIRKALEQSNRIAERREAPTVALQEPSADQSGEGGG